MVVEEAAQSVLERRIQGFTIDGSRQTVREPRVFFRLRQELHSPLRNEAVLPPLETADLRARPSGVEDQAAGAKTLRDAAREGTPARVRVAQDATPVRTLAGTDHLTAVTNGAERKSA